MELSLNPASQNRYGFAGCNPVTYREVDGHYGDYDVTNAEAYWCAAYPRKCYDVDRLRREATNLEGELTRRGRLNARPDHTGDAFRHCYWIGSITLKFGVDTAKEVGFNHEWRLRERGETLRHYTNARRMDLHNNLVGRTFAVQIAGSNGGHESDANKLRLQQKCLRATMRGRPRLWVLDGSERIRLARGRNHYGRLVTTREAFREDAKFVRYVYENQDDYPPPG